jgi:WD40 repeat protein
MTWRPYSQFWLELCAARQTQNILLSIDAYGRAVFWGLNAGPRIYCHNLAFWVAHANYDNDWLLIKRLRGAPRKQRLSSCLLKDVKHVVNLAYYSHAALATDAEHLLHARHSFLTGTNLRTHTTWQQRVGRGEISSIAIDPQNLYAAACTKDGVVACFHLSSGSGIWREEREGPRPTMVRFPVAERPTLVVGYADGTLRIYTITSESFVVPQAEIKTPHGTITAFTASKWHYAAGDYRGNICWWRIGTSPMPLPYRKQHKHPICYLQLNPTSNS